MPRWRTMIEPAVTSWPSPALTPRRWPTLSRPFLTLPPAFLWAISSTRPSSWRGAASAPLGFGVGAPSRRCFGAAPWLGLRLGGGRLRGRPRLGGRRPWRPSPSSAWPRALRRGLRSRPSSALAVVALARRRVGPTASLAASSASLAACAAAASSRRWRSVLACVSAFLADFGGALAAEHDVADAQDRQLLAVALLDPAAGLRAVLEGDELGAARLADDLGADRGVRDHRPADRRVVAVGDEQDAVEGDRLAGLDVEQLDFELGADLDAVLLPAGLDDCVHGSSGLRVLADARAATATSDMGWRAARPRRRTRSVRRQARNGQSCGTAARQLTRPRRSVPIRSGPEFRA